MIFKTFFENTETSRRTRASNGRKRFIWKPVLQKGTSSRCVLFIYELSKHDNAIDGPVKVQTSRKAS